ncbi:MAG: hypothetical protein KH828_04840 [Clostridiales bacterium]|nr:hypothetical protein [Clostridiales bacterium]
MSKFLKIIVNIILIAAILVAGGLLIPPFAGVTTVVVDDVDMETNLAKGSVTYALDRKGDPKEGSKVLVNEGQGQYVYEVTAVNGEVCTLEDKLSVDGETKEMTLGSSAKKVLFTIPFIGYASMALRTTEGLIIVGLAVVFLIVLFILAEVWKKDEDEDEEDEPEDEEEAVYAEEEEEPELSKRQQKKARKAEAKAEKKARKAEAKAEKKARKAGVDLETEAEAEVAATLEAPMAQEQTEPAEDEKALFAETESFLAADVASLMEQEIQRMKSEKEEEQTKGEISDLIQEGAPKAEEAVQEEAAEEETEAVQEKRLAMPTYSKEELLQKAKAAGDEPNVIEDEISGVTLVDYSDIL